MNEQLKRIREKDYTKIDQTIFQNINRTENLNSTLSHLSEFQQFLLQQITALNTSNKESNKSTASLQCSIAKNFQTLRESLVKCSRVITCKEKEGGNQVKIKQKFKKLEDQMFKLKRDIKSQVANTCKEAKQNAETTIKMVMKQLEKEKILRMQAEQKCTLLARQREMLFMQNKKLKQTQIQSSKGQNGSETFRSVIHHKSQNPSREHSAHKSTTLHRHNKESVQDSHEESMFANIEPVVLRENINNFSSKNTLNFPVYSQKNWKIDRKSLIQNSMGGLQPPKRSSLTRQTSNHRISSKQNINFAKQNEALLSKGVRDQRRKSKQKIKIYSLMG